MPKPKTDSELLMVAYEKTGAAHAAIHGIFDVGTKQPVPAALFVELRNLLLAAQVAAQELERRAAGCEPAKMGD